MGFKAILFLCLLAVVRMITSEVTTRDLAEITNAAEKRTNGLKESKYPGGGYGGYPRGGYGVTQVVVMVAAAVVMVVVAPAMVAVAKDGRGCRCCSFACEAVDAEPETEPQN